MRARHAEPLGVRIHELREGLLGARDAFSQRDGGIVARLHDHAENQELDGHRLAELDEGARALRAPGVLAHHDGLIQLERPRGELLEDDVGRHQLGEARRLHAGVGVQGRQRLVGAEVDDEVGARIDRRRRRNGNVGAEGAEVKRGQQQEGEQGTRHVERAP